MFRSRVIAIALTAVILESCRTTPPAVTDQSTSTPVEDPVLVQLGDNSFTSRDFAASYEKNKYSVDLEKPLTPEEYLELYTNMKLKVLAAKKEGTDTTQTFRDEITTYREILSQNFMNDKDLIEQFALEAFERSGQEVHASHILIRVPEFAAPQDTLAAWEKAMKIWDELNKGADFGETAVKYSEDPSARSNRGDLGSFSVFQMVYPFETAAYTTPVGQFSKPVRSVHGYHIVKVHSRNKDRGKIQVAHCMVQTQPNAPAEVQNAARERINEAYAKLQSGTDWAEVVREYSDDRRSRQNEGALPPFGIGSMIRPFEEAAFALKSEGEISKPVQTDYGWHIIRLLKKIPAETYEEAAPVLRQKVVQDSRGKLVEKIKRKNLLTQYPVTENPDVLKRVEELVDSTLLQARWTIPHPVAEDLSNAHLFILGRQPHTAGEFLEYLKDEQRPVDPRSSVPLVLKKYYEDFIGEKLTDYAKSQLEKDQPEFQQLMQEITDGVLLSNMMEKYVWGKSLSDSLGQRAIYEQNKEKYRYPERALATVVTAADTAHINRAKRYLSVSPYRLELKGKDLLFAEKSSELDNEAVQNLRAVVSVLMANPEYIVEISGYRDGKEPAETSEKRLNSVVSFLRNYEIPLTRIIEKNFDALGAGNNHPNNRRVSFAYYSTSAKDVERVLNLNNAGVTIREGYMTKDDPLLQGAAWQTGEQLHATGTPKKWILIKNIEAPRLKTFEEARGAVINEYQQILEQQWLNSLKNEYPVSVNQEELRKIK